MADQLIESLTDDVRPDQVPRHLPRAGARADRAQGRRRGGRHRRRPSRRRTRSSTSWPPSRRRSPRPRRPAAATRRRREPATASSDEIGRRGRRREPPRRSRPQKPPRSRPEPSGRPPWSTTGRSSSRAQRLRLSGTSTRSCTPRPGSPRPRSSTTTSASRRRCCPHLADRASPCAATPTGSTASRSSRSAARRTAPTGCGTVLGPGDRGGGIDYCCLDSIAGAGVGRQHGRPRAPRPDGARRRHRVAPRMVRVRPRPRRAGRHDRVRPGRPGDPRRARRASASSAWPRRRARRACSSTCRSTRPHTHEHASVVRPRRRPGAREAPPRRGHVGDGQGAARPGKVFIDWSQNSRHKTTIAAYSLRARPAPDGVDAGDLGRGRATPPTGDDPLALRGRRRARPGRPPRRPVRPGGDARAGAACDLTTPTGQRSTGSNQRSSASAGPGGAIRAPWPRSQPSVREISSSWSVSMPSATTVSSRTSATPRAAPATALARARRRAPRAVAGRGPRCRREAIAARRATTIPPPKPVSATRTPCARQRSSTDVVRAGSTRNASFAGRDHETSLARARTRRAPLRARPGIDRRGRPGWGAGRRPRRRSATRQPRRRHSAPPRSSARPAGRLVSPSRRSLDGRPAPTRRRRPSATR